LLIWRHKALRVFGIFGLKVVTCSFFVKLGLHLLTDSSDSEMRCCKHLAENECSLPYKDRPVECLMWNCKSFIENFQHDDFIKLAFLTKQLFAIIDESAKLYHTEKKLLQHKKLP